MTMAQFKKTSDSLVLFFLYTLSITWFFWIFAILVSRGSIEFIIPPFAFVVLGAHGPLVASIILVRRQSRASGLRSFLLSGLIPKLPLRWWLVSILAPLAIAAVAFLAGVLFHEVQPSTSLLLDNPYMIPGTFLFMFFLGGSLQEEFGWRGYALPRLLQRYNPVVASVVLGVIWGFWHWPLFFITGLSQSFMSFPVFMMLTLSFSFWFTWLHLKTKGNIFAALLLHTGLNTAFSVFPPVDQTQGDSTGMVFLYLTIIFWIVTGIIIWHQWYIFKDRAGMNDPRLANM